MGSFFKNEGRTLRQTEDFKIQTESETSKNLNWIDIPARTTNMWALVYDSDPDPKNHEGRLNHGTGCTSTTYLKSDLVEFTEHMQC